MIVHALPGAALAAFALWIVFAADAAREALPGMAFAVGASVFGPMLTLVAWHLVAGFPNRIHRAAALMMLLPVWVVLFAWIALIAIDGGLAPRASLVVAATFVVFNLADAIRTDPADLLAVRRLDAQVEGLRALAVYAFIATPLVLLGVEASWPGPKPSPESALMLWLAMIALVSGLAMGWPHRAPADGIVESRPLMRARWLDAFVRWMERSRR